MREGDGQFSAGVRIAEDHVGRCGSAFFAEIEALKNCRNILRDVVDRKRPPIQQQHDDRLAGFNNGLHKIVLRAQQVERIAIAKVILSPRFAVGALVFADDNDRNIGLLRSIDRGLDRSRSASSDRRVARRWPTIRGNPAAPS